MTTLRAHTKRAHQMTITEYKAEYGADLVPVELVWHRLVFLFKYFPALCQKKFHNCFVRCGVCGELVMLDSDHIAVHLKRGGESYFGNIKISIVYFMKIQKKIQKY